MDQSFNIQDLLDYAESRFRRILQAIEQAPETKKNDMQTSLCKELVCNSFLKTVVISSIFF
jgi:hypothetical protein